MQSTKLTDNLNVSWQSPTRPEEHFHAQKKNRNMANILIKLNLKKNYI